MSDTPHTPLSVTPGQFDTRYARELPETYAHVTPSPLREPHWVCWNQALADDLALPAEPDEQVLKACSGAGLFEGTQPIAQKYAGHQFGVWNPDLGDGRGLLLGEWVDASGQYWDFHLKGAGKTPFSRFGDGRAVLRSSIREFLASEALHALGIPTTRALALVGSNEPVQREVLERGAMLTRVARTHIRFGHFEWFAFSEQTEQLERLTEYTIHHHFPDCLEERDPTAAFFVHVVDRTARLMAHWMANGFCHGVMNTDNMSIIGDTFDYGPYAFLDATRPDFVCNHTDVQGRYAFNRQPDIAFWNLQCLAQALVSQTDQSALKDALQTYASTYNAQFLTLMGERLGIAWADSDDQELISEWMQLLASEASDFHLSFRRLADRPVEAWSELDDDYVDRDRFRHWRQALAERLTYEPDQGRPLAQARNPVTVLRTHLAQEVIEAAERGDSVPMRAYLEALQSPFEHRDAWKHWGEAPPENTVARPLSCSS